eukprot:TRINITY_DN15600_c0_g2_i1.p1 TRINITY_DN15600_c0_g2~~TRINITY_DN15600_c0_g2_i1.p1  ORF type:complete len:570 (+),score=143.19 TRINITY_DN15600_c0_g2_i1:42-1712(+)
MGLCQSSAKDILPSLDLESQAGQVDVQKLIRRSKARQFPSIEGTGDSKPSKVSDLDRSAGQCLFFLEQACNVPVADALRDITCEAVKAVSHGHPAVTVWVESATGERVGQVLEWPQRRCNLQPSWFSAQSLGFALVDQPSAVLRLELRDGSTKLGKLAAPLKDLAVHQTVTMELEAETKPGVKPCTISFQILCSEAVVKPRTVYLVRHGESSWNKAQSKLDLHEMARTTDHPLSARGREQAELLCERLRKEAKKEAAGEAPDPAVAAMLHPGVVFTSPLARALQTAVIGLGPILAQGDPGFRELTLLTNAKEKQNFGGLDTHCTKVGKDILDAALDQLRGLYATPETQGVQQPAVLETFARLSFDLEEVQDVWWPEGQTESSQQLQVRLKEFMQQLLYASHSSIVVFGHSLFFQHVLRNYLSEEFRQKEPKLATDLGRSKLSNCGVVRLELDPSRSLEEGPFVKAELVLGSELLTEGAGVLSCCNSPAEVQGMEGQLEIVAPEVLQSKYDTNAEVTGKDQVAIVHAAAGELAEPPAAAATDTSEQPAAAVESASKN